VSGLSSSQIESLREQLRQRQAQLLSEVQKELAGHEDQSYNELAGRVRDLGDEATADLLSDLGITLMDRQVRELSEIEVALRSIEAGSYGECIDCGGEIGVQRLSAYPTALRCVDCQGKYDSSHPGTGSPSL